MPGIVLTYNKKASTAGLQMIGNDVAERMYGCEKLKLADIIVGDKVFLKMVCRNGDYFGISNTDEGFCAWFGRPLYQGKPLNEGIVNVFKEIIYRSGIKAVIRDISGHFQMVVYLKERGECYVVCDKTSSHPLYYAQTADFIVFSPEPLAFKALKQYGWSPTIRKGAIFEYLSAGYLWGDECFWKEVKRLGPGKLICLDHEGIKIETYWQMSFERSGVNEQSLIGELYESIRKDIRDLPKGKKILTLSGGYDSRALLGFLKASNEQVNTISYSFGSKAEKRMDMDLGGYYAAKAGASCSCYQASTDDPLRLIADIHSVVLATGGENHFSISQDAFLGVEFYRRLADQYDYMIRGDEVWGWEDFAVDYSMAFRESRLFNLDEMANPKKIMNRDMYDCGIKYINGRREEFIKECGTPKILANDLKDYLYWRHREARLLQSMAYFRRCYIPHFAPFLFDRTLSVIQKTPSKHRVQKNLFIKMSRKMFPELFLENNFVSLRQTDSNNFCSLYKNPVFRSFVKTSLLESRSDVFNDIFDKKLFRFWIDKVMDGSSNLQEAVQECDLKRLAVDLIGRLAYLKGHMKSFITRQGWNMASVLDVNYLFRLVALSLALQEYDRV